MSEKNSQDNRSEARVTSALPVDLGGGGAGMTRDVSASGIFFEIDATYALGSSISFTVKLDTPGGPVNLNCQGEIVRIEPRGPKVGVAVKIIESAMEAAS